MIENIPMFCHRFILWSPRVQTIIKITNRFSDHLATTTTSTWNEPKAWTRPHTSLTGGPEHVVVAC